VATSVTLSGSEGGQAALGQRVVEVDGESYGSGYVIGRGLVLTARHIVGPSSTCRTRLLGREDWQPAEVVWPPLGQASSDVVLLRPVAGGAERLGIVPWGTVVPGDPVRVQAVGFAWTMAGPTGPDGTQVRDTEQAWGHVVPEAGVKSGRLMLAVDSLPRYRKEGSAWAGMSGAAVLAWPEGHLLGVVVSDMVRSAGRLAAIPVANLVADRSFAELVGAPEIELVAVAPSPLEAPFAWLPPDSPECLYLDPRYGVVRFLDPDGYLNRLTAWCEGEEIFGVGCLLGEGGSGKSRLAAELCRIMLNRGWYAGVVRELDSASSWEGFDPRQPTLIVFDYAEPTATAAGRLAWSLRHRRDRPRVRILLVGRDLGTWWEQVEAQSGHMVSEQRREIWTLGELGDHELDRVLHAETAVTDFAKELNLPECPAPDVSAAAFVNPLLIHIAVLLQLRSFSEGGLTLVASAKRDILARLIDREEKRWLEARERFGLDARLRPRTARQVLSAITLTAPARADALKLLTAVPGLSDYSLRMDVVDWLREVLPRSDPFTPLRPDLAVEELLHRTPDLAALITGLYEHNNCSKQYQARMLQTLRIAATGQQHVQAALNQLLAVHPELESQSATDGLLDETPTGSDRPSTGLSPDPNALIVHGLCARSHGNWRLTDVSFALRDHTLLVVIGPSGAGKSSLLFALLGELPMEAGQIYFRSLPMATRFAEIRALIGFVPQQVDLFSTLTVRHLLRFEFHLRSTGGRRACDRAVVGVCGQLDLSHQIDQLVSTLSGAQRRRLSIAVELLTAPPLLLLDEPTSGLDTGAAQRLMLLLREYAMKGHTVIVTANTAEHLHLAHAVLAVSRHGEPVYFGSPRSIRRDLRVTTYAQMMEMLVDDPAPFAQAYRDGPVVQQVASHAQNASCIEPIDERLVPRRSSASLNLRRLHTLTRRQLLLVSTRARTVKDRPWPYLINTSLIASLPLLVAGGSAALITLIVGAPGLGGPSTAPTALTLLTTLCVLTGQALTYSEVVDEIGIIKREFRVGVGAVQVLTAKWLVYAMIAVVQAGLITLVASLVPNWAPHQSIIFGPGFDLFLSLAALTVAAMTLGLLVSSLAYKLEQAVALITVTSIAQIALNGITTDLSKPSITSILAEVLPDRWGVSAVASSTNLRGMSKGHVTQVAVDALWQHSPAQWLYDLGSLALLSVFFFALAAWRLNSRLHPQRH
jgi:ABC-type multidrug transport system ATPase subunit